MLEEIGPMEYEAQINLEPTTSATVEVEILSPTDNGMEKEYEKVPYRFNVTARHCLEGESYTNTGTCEVC